MRRKEIAIILVIVAVAIIARIIGINWRPPSNDEMGHIFYGIQALHGTYVYNPEWHGPLEHYIIALCLLIAPFSKNPFFTVALIRFFYSLFSILAGIIAFFFLDDYLNLPGRAIAASLIMLSPETLYYSRFIHESALMAPLMLSCAIFFLKYLKTFSPRYLYLSVFFFSLGFVTKESWIIYLGIWLSFALILYLSAKIKKYENILAIFKRLRERGNAKRYAISLGIFLAISFFFYSSIGRNPVGFLMGFIGPLHWVGRVHGHIVAPFYYWFDRIWLYDLYLIPAVIYAAWKENDDITAFFIYWFIISFAFYSYIQEKLPRLMPNITLPGMIIAAKAFDRAYEKIAERRFDLRNTIKKAGAIAFVILIGISFWQSYLANYVNYDNPIEPLIYPKLPHQWYSFYHQVWKDQMEGKEVSVGIYWPNSVIGYVNVFMLWFTYADPTPWARISEPSEIAEGNYTFVIVYQYYLSSIPQSILKQYKVLGPYPVLVWVFHEEWTTKTTLSGFLHDFSHYVNPEFYFLRKCPPLPESAWRAYLLVKKRFGMKILRKLYKREEEILEVRGGEDRIEEDPPES